ncbi:MAG: hypothetical protein GY842_21055 [bacterium]|nr:hypothetical protein [bacterium]
MIVTDKCIGGGVEVEVINGPDFFGWRASGRTVAEALEYLAAAVGVEGYRGSIRLWRGVPQPQVQGV